jgi:carbon-monoxide dehydrogenase medium subunit
MLNLRLAQVGQMVDLSRLDALRGFELRADVLRIGAAVTHARIEDGELPDVTHGLLPSVASNIAYRAVRNRGTLGGSLAHADPAADWVSTMRLLDAAIVLQGPSGERSLPASEFLLGPFTTALAADEIVVAVDVPCFSPDARCPWDPAGPTARCAASRASSRRPSAPSGSTRRAASPGP